MNKLDAKHFHDDNAARAYLESIRWPNGPVCPHCGNSEKIWKVKSRAARPGVYKCGNPRCYKQFTVTVGTLFERSKVPLHMWVQATFLMCSSKKGISSHQLHRILGVAYQTAWFMTHRLREAMKDGSLFPEPMGGAGSIVQADETYFGKQNDPQPAARRRGRAYTKGGRSGPSGKRAVVALISEGQARTFHVRHANAKTVREILVRNTDRASELHTDESRLYLGVGREYAAHRRVTHSVSEYVGKDGQHTNTVENYFSIFKRGMKGVYQHCAEKHLQRYINEFDFRYNHRKISDVERTQIALRGIEGKRLTYRPAYR